MQKKILVVDDDKLEREAYRALLEKYGFHIKEAANGAEGLVLANEFKPDLILTDNVMPVMDGFTLCKIIRQTTELARTPVIIISANKVEEEDAVLGYNLGVDDYIIKPVSLELLHAKVLAVLKRYEPLSGGPDLLDRPAISKLGITVDPVCRTVSVKGTAIKLTRKEFDLLIALLSGNGRLLSSTYLLETIWGYDSATYNNPHTVINHVSSLRKKLGPEAGAHIIAVTGHGYKIE